MIKGKVECNWGKRFAYNSFCIPIFPSSVFISLIWYIGTYFFSRQTLRQTLKTKIKLNITFIKGKVECNWDERFAYNSFCIPIFPSSVFISLIWYIGTYFFSRQTLRQTLKTKIKLNITFIKGKVECNWDERFAYNSFCILILPSSYP